MKNVQIPILLCLTLCILFISEKKEAPKQIEPLDYMYSQRAFPNMKVNTRAYQTAIEQAQQLRQHTATESNLTWLSEGPTNIGGRITSLAVHPNNFNIVYAGAASGGVWRSVDGGTSWQPIFDDMPTLSIGDIAVSASPQVSIVVGTGEANGGGGSLAYDGLGVFRSVNGSPMEYLGLSDVGSIGKVLIHPQFPERIYVGAMGDLFEKNPQRGVFRTLDDGQTWEKVLYINDSTGVIDMAFSPNNPNHIYAATWERIRSPNGRKYGGAGCGIHRSIDGGTTWVKLENDLPQEDNGRIGLAVTPADPNIIFALYESEDGFSKGVYRSYDKGQTWAQPIGSQDISYPGYGWWFGKLYIAPSDAQQVYALGLVTHKSIDGALNFEEVAPDDIHIDQHALAIDPTNPNNLYLGNDGGFYRSYDGGDTWEHRPMPITQFYTCAVSKNQAEYRFGGTQDNGTWRRRDSAPDSYEFMYGGDGFYVSINQDEPNYLLLEYQFGGIVYSENGGDSFQATVGDQILGRKNWNTPIVRDASQESTVYTGSESLYRSLDNGLNWAKISSDLSTGNSQSSSYGTITTISVSTMDENTIWVGTDDGNVQVSTNGGSDFTLVSDNLPMRWVTRVVADPFDAQTAYVTFSGYRYNDYLPHVFRTQDLGQTWENISGDLPEAPANDLIVDPLDPNHLFVATDMGVFETMAGGTDWIALADGMPIVVVNDLDFNPMTRLLLAGSYGRGFYSTVVPAPVSTKNVAENEVLFSIAPNPASDFVFIKKKHNEGGNASALSVEILDMQGQVLVNRALENGAGEWRVSLVDLRSATYVYRVFDKKTGRVLQSDKFVKY